MAQYLLLSDARESSASTLRPVNHSCVLYIGIPAHNEATTIGVLLWRLRSVLADVSREYEVVVYDDASTDQTAQTLAPYSRVLPLTLLSGTRRLGYAGAVDAIVRHVARTTRYPRRDGLLLLQGDFTDPPALVPEFLRRFEGGADLIIGERTTAGDAPTAVKRLWSASRWVLRPFVGISDVRDLTTSYRLVRISVLRDLIKAAGDAPVLTGDVWAANADFLLRAAPHARRVETLPVTPTFGVRTRDSRRTAWPDAIALAKWGWGHRGQRVAVKVVARTVDVPSEMEEALAEPEERAAVSERPERRPRREKPAREGGRDGARSRGARERSVERAGERSGEGTPDLATDAPERTSKRTGERPARGASSRNAERANHESQDGSDDQLTERDGRVVGGSNVDDAAAVAGSAGDEAVAPAREKRPRRKRGRRDRTRRSADAEGAADGDVSDGSAEHDSPYRDENESDSGNADSRGDQSARLSGDDTDAISTDDQSAADPARPKRKRTRRGRRRKDGASGEARDGQSDVSADDGDDQSSRSADQSSASSDLARDDSESRGGERPARRRNRAASADSGDDGAGQADESDSESGGSGEESTKRRRSRRGRRGGAKRRGEGSGASGGESGADAEATPRGESGSESAAGPRDESSAQRRRADNDNSSAPDAPRAPLADD